MLRFVGCWSWILSQTPKTAPHVCSSSSTAGIYRSGSLRQLCYSPTRYLLGEQPREMKRSPWSRLVVRLRVSHRPLPHLTAA